LPAATGDEEKRLNGVVTCFELSRLPQTVQMPFTRLNSSPYISCGEFDKTFFAVADAHENKMMQYQVHGDCTIKLFTDIIVAKL
jgi:hypothetical protein